MAQIGAMFCCSTPCCKDNEQKAAVETIASSPAVLRGSLVPDLIQDLSQPVPRWSPQGRLNRIRDPERPSDPGRRSQEGFRAAQPRKPEGSPTLPLHCRRWLLNDANASNPISEPVAQRCQARQATESPAGQREETSSILEPVGKPTAGRHKENNTENVLLLPHNIVNSPEPRNGVSAEVFLSPESGVFLSPGSGVSASDSEFGLSDH